jgi:hypothetical protein
MHTDMQPAQPNADAPSCRTEPSLPLSTRLTIAALVTAANLWIGMAQVIPDNHGLVNRARRETT